MTNAEAVEVTLAELQRMGRVESIDTAAVEALRHLAAAVDDMPTNAHLWKVYRDHLEALTSDGVDDDALATLLDELSTEVRDTPPT